MSATTVPQETDVRVRTEHSVRIELGHSDVRLGTWNGKRLFRPTEVTLTWTHRDDAWALTNAVVTGRVVKKDGGDSLNTADRRYIDYGGGLLDPPDWLMYLIHEHTPTVVGR